MASTAAPLYPIEKITPEFVAELQRIDQAQGHAAGLARFRTAVADDPWFQQPGSHGPVDDMDRTEWEYSCLLTGEGYGQ